MILDKSLQLDSGLTFASFNAGTKYCTNWIDLTKTTYTQYHDVPVWGVVRVGTAFTDGTSLQISLMTSDAVPSAIDGTGLDSDVNVELVSPVILEAALTANTIVWKFKLPDTFRYRYLGMKYVTVGNHTTGTLDVDFTPQIALDALK